MNSLPAPLDDHSCQGTAGAFQELGFEGPFHLYTAAECRAILAQEAGPTRPRPADWFKGRAASDPFYAALASDERLLARLRPILGQDIILWGVDVIRRKPQAIHPWHCDIESAAPEGRFASIWIGLEHTSRESCLSCISRSHRFGRTIQEVAAQHGLKRGEASSDLVLAWARAYDPQAELFQPDMNNGDALLFDGRIWHGTHNTRWEGVRSALLLQYAAADCPVRMLYPDYFEWPFRFRSDTWPPVIAVSGSANCTINRVVVPPPRQPVRQIAFVARPLSLPLAKDDAQSWAPFPQFRGSTATLPLMGCHISVLDPGHSPHLPHAHREEEILIMLDGEAEVAVATGADDPEPRWKRVSRGQLSYYPAFRYHTIRNRSSAPITYLMFKWIGGRQASNSLGPLVVDFRAAMANPDERAYASKLIFEKPTLYLKTLHCHLTTLKPGAGYEPHVDPYDVALVMLDGKIETIDATIENDGVIYYSAGQSHGMRNTGTKTASYLVFEFHAA